MIYVTFSVSIDIAIAAQRKPEAESGYDFNPACAILLTEVVKLVISALLYVSLLIFDRSQAVANLDNLTPRAVVSLLLPAVVFTVNNILVFVALGHNDTSTFGVFRDTMIIWTAILWRTAFKTPLGWTRMVAIGVILIGLVVNQVPNLSSGLMTLTCLWVLLMTFCNSVGSVVNEYAMKFSFGLNINVQNMILYSSCVLCTFLFIIASDRSKIANGPSSYFTGFTSNTFLLVGLQAATGLIVSRMLKYADSVMKTVSACLRGPIFVVVAPIFVRTSSWHVLPVISSVIVASGCCWYMLQGPLQTPKIDQTSRLGEPAGQAGKVDMAKDGSVQGNR